MKLRLLIIVAMCSVTFNAIAAEPCLTYSTTVTLSGKITKRTFYGPPNYGEDLATDSHETQVLLLLPKPICVDENKIEYYDAEKNQLELTLVPLGKIEVINYMGKQVTVHGKLFHAHTGHHHTPVLVEVLSIE